MEAWKQFIEQQEEEFGTETVLKWLHPLKIVRFDACNLYLEAHDSFQANWFEEHIRPKVVGNFFNNNKKRIKIHLSVSKNEVAKTANEKWSSSQKIREKEATKPPQYDLVFDTIDPHCCFDEYIEPLDNPLPYKLLSSLEGKEFPTYNPIFLYGQTGSGKSHLLMAAAQLLEKQGLKVLYVRADTFTEHVVAAIRAGEMRCFRQAYRSADVLIVDDVQVFARKAATQEEFFHTFNTLHLAGKQIILAANCAPQALTNIEPRLISRFEWGIVLPLHLLKKEELESMLEKKCHVLGCSFPKKIISFLLETFPSGSKALTQALQALILRTHLNEFGNPLSVSQLSIPQVKALLNDLEVEEQKKELTSQKIIQHVCEYFGILIEDLKGKAQSRERVLPRQIAMYFCRKELKLPFLKIGEIFSRDHSTVMSSVKIIQTAIDQAQHEVLDSVEAIRKRLNS